MGFSPGFSLGCAFRTTAGRPSGCTNGRHRRSPGLATQAPDDADRRIVAGGLPAAFALLDAADVLDAAAARALEDTERELAARLLAERVRVVEQFEADYRLPWDGVRGAVTREVVHAVYRDAGRERGTASVRVVPDPFTCLTVAAAAPFARIARRLGYCDGVRSRLRQSSDVTRSASERPAHGDARAAARQLTVAECELVARGSLSAVIAGEAWVRTYRATGSVTTREFRGRRHC